MKLIDYAAESPEISKAASHVGFKHLWGYIEWCANEGPLPELNNFCGPAIISQASEKGFGDY